MNIELTHEEIDIIFDWYCFYEDNGTVYKCEVELYNKLRSFVEGE